MTSNTVFKLKFESTIYSTYDVSMQYKGLRNDRSELSNSTSGFLSSNTCTVIAYLHRLY